MKQASIFIFVFFPLLVGCGRSEVFDFPPEDSGPPSSSEICDGVDNDIDGRVDEPFLTDAGIYLDDNHCGACDSPCVLDDVTAATSCVLFEGAPRCVATDCIDDYVVDNSGKCVPQAGWLCKSCIDALECGDFPQARCEEIFGDNHCTYSCAGLSCPDGYECGVDGHCVPSSGSCACGPGDDFSVYCEIPLPQDAGVCYGQSACVDGGMAECVGSDEICDGQDNDCNGTVDDPYVNVYGKYGVDLYNCGGCGVDCTVNPLPVSDLTCGGPPTDPFCAMLCVDTMDGVQVGDSVDADLLISTGCECVVQTLADAPGPLLAGPETIDPNCDGADGIVANSFYVSPDGSDINPGSHLNPMETITAAVDAAYASLSTSTPRPHVFVSAGTYPEVLELKDGVSVHGGYAPDYLTWSPDTFVTEVIAPSWSGSPGGAALVATDIGTSAPTVVQGIHFKGASALTQDEPSVGAYLVGCGAQLVIENCTVQAGEGVDGTDGTNGTPGAFSSGAGYDGALPRGAVESPSHDCLTSSANTVLGGGGDPLWCGGTNVSGGDGGDSDCPGDSNTYQASGSQGDGPPSAPGGDGGDGGWNARGPMFSVDGCPYAVCCGLAHFLVSGDYHVAYDGESGSDGQDGTAGQACTSPLGVLQGSDWSPATSGSGTAGTAGGGGGGGGAGGGALIQWVSSDCEYADGLGGGGGGGGAGGCGGTGGQGGSSGGPAIAMVITTDGAMTIPPSPPTIQNVVFVTGQGGEGGAGGTGGSGGLGSSGGGGGYLPPTSQITPTLAGPSSGGHGGHGGSGGGGGGGGGGCGGSTVGIWLDVSAFTYPTAGAVYGTVNTFSLGTPGQGGNGGGGSVNGQQGSNGEAHNVHHD